MFDSTFVRHYFINPFLIWGLLLAVITTFDSALLSNQIMSAIITQNLYIPILFIMITFIIIITLYPLLQGLQDLARKGGKSNIFFAVSSPLLVLMMSFADGVFFLSDPMVILATLQPQIVTDKETYEYAVLVKHFSQFIILPFLGAFVYANIKNKLIKESLEIHGKFRDNLKFVVEIVIINTSMYGVYLLITSKPA